MSTPTIASMRLMVAAASSRDLDMDWAHAWASSRRTSPLKVASGKRLIHVSTVLYMPALIQWIQEVAIRSLASANMSASIAYPMASTVFPCSRCQA